MRVQKTENNPSFGYNQRLNTRVIEKLTSAKNNKPFFNALLKINTLTNELENQIRKAEASKNKGLVYKLEGPFVMLKDYLTSTFSELFPKINYAAIETSTYAAEFAERQEKDPNHWGYNLINTLSDHIGSSKTTFQGTLVRSKDGNLYLCDEEGNAIKQMTLDELPEEIRSQVEALPPIEEAQRAISEDDDDAVDAKSLVKEFVPDESEKLGFAGLAGLDNLKQMLTRKVVNLLKDPEEAKLYAKYGKKLPRGILLYGPPGCGKTSIAKRLSVEANVPLLLMQTGKFGTSYYHQTSKNTLAIYDYAKSIATTEKPVLLLFDDCDSMFAKRNGSMERFETEELNTLLDAIEDGSKHNVITIATTNRFDMLDEAIKGRLSVHAEIPLPDFETRKTILKFLLKPIEPCADIVKNEEAIETLAKKLEKFSVRDYHTLIDSATDKALFDKNGARNVTVNDFIEVIETPDFQNRKIDEKLYESKNTRKTVGFVQ